MKLIVGNWKMNPQTSLQAKEIFLAIRRTADKLTRVKTVICPPFLYVGELEKLVKSKQAVVGAQNLSAEKGAVGSFTGEVSAGMLASAGASHVIIGHSERRAMGETNGTVNVKVLHAIREGLIAVLCVGESARDTDGLYLDFIKNELKECLVHVQVKDLKRIVIAYEPIWAIGKSDADAMSARDIHEMTIYIKKVLSDIFGHGTATRMPVLYGGSVTSRISEAILRDGEVDGLLVGRASLDAKDFSAILKQANEV